MPGKRVEVLIHTRLQPGDRECRASEWQSHCRNESSILTPLKPFPDLSLLEFTWLKPAVNEIGLAGKKIQ